MTVAEQKAQLREEFPGWSIVYSTEGRWWAFRNQEQDAAARRLAHRKVTDVDADTGERLRAELLKAEQE